MSSRHYSVSRYFELPKDRVHLFRATLVPDNDVLPLDIFKNAKSIYTINDKVILEVCIDYNNITNIQEIADVLDPLSLEAVAALDITTAYIGPSILDVYRRYPHLVDTEYLGTDPDTGDSILKPPIKQHTWLR